MRSISRLDSNKIGKLDIVGESAPVYSGTGAGLRMLIYSHDSFGLGHLRRCLKISGALKACYPDLSILLVTGSPQVHRYILPAGIDYVKLPAVRKTADEQYEPRSMATTFERVFNLRSHMLLDTVKDYLPHLLLVDHSPLGMKGEMRPALDWLRTENRATETILGLRDILDEPEKIVPQWQAKGMYGLMMSYYDHILIYGCPTVFNPVESYQFPRELAAKSSFCGYIAEQSSDRGNGNGALKHKKFVLVTIGGGDGAGEIVVGTFIDMLRRYADLISFDSMAITGPFIAEELWGNVRTRAKGLPIVIRKFVSQTRPYLQKSDLVISTGGYNSTTEILTFARRALIIPRILYRKEQLLRARRLAELGIVSFMHPDQATPQLLFETINTHLADKTEPLSEARDKALLQFDGSARLVQYCGRIFSRLIK